MRLRLPLLAALAAVVAVVSITAATATAAPRTGSFATSAAGTARTGESVAGTFTITGFKRVNGVLTAVGTFAGTVDGVAKTDTASAPVTAINGHTLSSGASSAVTAQQAADPTCQVLTLTLGPLHLDVLGLVVDLNQVNLNITAQSGPGNLLGNLLCSVAHLLDNTGGGGGGGGLSGLLQGITNLLNQILAAL
jgi:hypothetical protein